MPPRSSNWEVVLFYVILFGHLLFVLVDDGSADVAHVR